MENGGNIKNDFGLLLLDNLENTKNYKKPRTNWTLLVDRTRIITKRLNKASELNIEDSEEKE